MRVVFISAARQVWGAEVSLLTLAEALADQGVRVALVCPEGELAQRAGGAGIEQVYSVRPRSDALTKGRMRESTRLWGRYLRAARRGDVLVIFSYYLLAQAPAMRPLLRARGVRIVLDLHDDLVSRKARWAVRAGSRGVDAVIACSDFTAAQLSRHPRISYLHRPVAESPRAMPADGAAESGATRAQAPLAPPRSGAGSASDVDATSDATSSEATSPAATSSAAAAAARRPAASVSAGGRPGFAAAGGLTWADASDQPTSGPAVGPSSWPLAEPTEASRATGPSEPSEPSESTGPHPAAGPAASARDPRTDAGRGTAQRPLRVGIIGRITPEKRHHMVIEAMRRVHASAELVVRGAGDGFSGDLAHDVFEAGRRLLGDRWVPEGRVAQHKAVDDLDVLVVGNPREPMGRTVLEAQSRGVIAVVPDSGGSQELVEDRVTGLVYAAEDADDLARAIDTVAADAPLAARMAQAARVRVPRPAPYATEYLRRLRSLDDATAATGAR